MPVARARKDRQLWRGCRSGGRKANETKQKIFHTHFTPDFAQNRQKYKKDSLIFLKSFLFWSGNGMTIF